MGGNIFLIGDTHFGHKNIINYTRTQFESVEAHDEYIVEQWNNTVGKRDVVYHLGDVAFGKANLRHLARLNGIKKLVLGNHDVCPAAVYGEYFSKQYGCFDLHRHILLTHIPVHPGQKYRFAVNVHGHLHEAVIDDPWYFNVCCEHNDLTPVPLAAIMDRIKEL